MKKRQRKRLGSAAQRGITMKMKRVFILFNLLMCGTATAQISTDEIATEVFTLQEAYERVDQTHPFADKAEIQQQITDLNKRIARSGWLPEVQFSARTSYQSDVTEVPFSAPGTESPEFSKDHHHFSLDVTQPIFDGGRTRSMQTIEQYAGAAERANIESELLTVRSQLEQVWFGIVMMQKQEKTLKLRYEDIREQLGMVQAQVRNGVVLPGNEMVLKAELIRAEQELTGLRSDVRAGYKVLEEIIGMQISSAVSLKVPEIKEWANTVDEAIHRPEYNLFEAHESRLESQKKLTKADKLPSISFFATSAYGRPGLNVFDDDLQFYWIVGLRTQWSFQNTRNASLKKEMLDLQQRNLHADRNAFTRQLNTELRRAEEEIMVLQEQLKQDNEILKLSSQVVAEKRSLLERGVITSTDYITELNAESRARLNLEIRKIRLVQAITEYETKRGIPWK